MFGPVLRRRARRELRILLAKLEQSSWSERTVTELFFRNDRHSTRSPSSPSSGYQRPRSARPAAGPHADVWEPGARPVPAPGGTDHQRPSPRGRRSTRSSFVCMVYSSSSPLRRNAEGASISNERVLTRSQGPFAATVIGCPAPSPLSTCQPGRLRSGSKTPTTGGPAACGAPREISPGWSGDVRGPPRRRLAARRRRTARRTNAGRSPHVIGCGDAVGVSRTSTMRRSTTDSRTLNWISPRQGLMVPIMYL